MPSIEVTPMLSSVMTVPYDHSRKVILSIIEMMQYKESTPKILSGGNGKHLKN